MEFLGSNEEEMGVEALYRVGDPVTRGEGDRPPCRPLGGATGPLPSSPRAALSRDLFVKKIYQKDMSPPAWTTGILSPTPWATRAHFRNFLKRPHIFEILIFFKYKKEKKRHCEGTRSWTIGPQTFAIKPPPLSLKRKASAIHNFS